MPTSDASLGSFHARSVPDDLPRNTLYRVSFEPAEIVFTCVGGAKRYGLPGALERLPLSESDIVPQPLIDHATDRRDADFRVEFGNVALSAIESTWILSLLPGRLYCWWRLKLKRQEPSRMIFQFDTIDELAAAVEVLGETHANRVAWNPRRQKFVKTRKRTAVLQPDP
jgi:hypothetical protein